MTHQEMVRGLVRLAQKYQMYGVSHTLVEDLLYSGTKVFATRMLLVCTANPCGSPFYKHMVDMAQEVCILSLKYHDFSVAPSQVDELVSWMPDEAVYRLVGREGVGLAVGKVRGLLKSYIRSYDGCLDTLCVGDLANIRPRRIYELLIAG